MNSRLNRWLGDFLCAAILLAALAFSVEKNIEASYPLGSSGLRPELMLTAPASALQPSKVRLLNRLVVTHYMVDRKDSLWSLATSFGTNVDSIRSSNKMEILAVRPGQTLLIPNRRGFVVVTKKGDTLKSIISSFHRGKKDPKGFMQQITEANELSSRYAIEPYPEFEPGTQIFLPDTYLNFYEFIRPINGRLSGSFGRRFHPILKVWRRHTGVDIPKPYGTPVHAARAGVVTFAGWRSGYGQLIILRHKDGMSSWYGHLSEIKVQAGNQIGIRKIVGSVGSTGLSTGPHLHFEVRSKTGRPLNPRNYFR